MFTSEFTGAFVEFTSEFVEFTSEFVEFTSEFAALTKQIVNESGSVIILDEGLLEASFLKQTIAKVLALRGTLEFLLCGDFEV